MRSLLDSNTAPVAMTMESEVEAGTGGQLASRGPQACAACSTGAGTDAGLAAQRCSRSAPWGRRTSTGKGYRPRPCFEARLFGLLQRLEVSARRRLLTCEFSQQQRVALEAWVLAQRKAGTPCHKGPAGASQVCGQQPRTSAARTEARGMSGGASHCSVLPVAKGVQQQLPTRGFTGIRGICIHRNADSSVRYYARVTVGPFQFFSRHDTDLATVAKFHDALLGLQAVVLRDCAGGCNAGWDERLSLALEGMAAASGLDAMADMGLRFSVSISAKHWVGKTLTTPAYPLEKLQAGICVWRKLHKARSLVCTGHSNRYSLPRIHSPGELASAWLQLRQVYIDVWADAGYRPEIVSQKLRALEERQRPRRERTAARWALIQQSEEEGRPCGRPLLLRGGVPIAKEERQIDALLKRWAQHEAQLRRKQATITTRKRKRLAVQ